MAGTQYLIALDRAIFCTRLIFELFISFCTPARKFVEKMSAIRGPKSGTCKYIITAPKHCFTRSLKPESFFIRSPSIIPPDRVDYLGFDDLEPPQICCSTTNSRSDRKRWVTLTGYFALEPWANPHTKRIPSFSVPVEKDFKGSMKDSAASGMKKSDMMPEDFCRRRWST